VMEAYSSTLGRLAGLRARGWRTKDIDRTVLIDDASAKLGLDVLREKWIWSDFEEMEFQLGYGKAIHNFKNYLLRGYERYYVAALENLLTANALIARQLDLPQLRDPRDGAEAALDPPDTVNREDQTGDAQALQNMKDRLRRDRSALEALARVVRAYRENLTLVRELIAVQHSAQQIDRAILIYDVPAKAGLYRLRQAEAYLFQPATAGFED